VKILLLRWFTLALMVGIFTAPLTGCFVPGGGYYEGGDIGAGYYEPAGVVYGGWGPGYEVAPFRGGDHRPGGGGHAPSRAYRSAPASRSIPSIPSKSRGGGGSSRSR
jgi:hypothetical protein